MLEKIKRNIGLMAVLSLCLMISSCASLGRMGINTVSPAVPVLVDNIMQMDNLRIAREGFPGLIVLVSGLLEFTPENLDLLSIASMAYGAYGLIVEDDDPEYASSLYLKGKEYGLRALYTNKRFKKDMEKGLKIMDAIKNIKDKKYVPAIFWTGMGWGLWAFQNLDDATAPIGLPTILAMVKKVEELDDTYFFGGTYFFQMCYNSVLPAFAGGGPKKVEASLKKVEAVADGAFMLPYVYYAKFYARPYGKRKAYHDYLTKVMKYKTDRKDLRLANEIAKAKARVLLAKEGEYFKYEF